MTSNELKKVTVLNLRARKTEGPKIVLVTGYDYTFARLFDETVDAILVGDSLGMVMRGESSTLSVTVDDIIYHCRSVARGIRYPHLVADMPFMSYQTGVRDALKNAGRLLAEGGAESVKLEGGVSIAPTVAKLVGAGIPVMGHVGLTPQSVHAFGGFRIQGKTETARNSILEDAVALEEAGAYAIVLEGMPSELAEAITSRVSIPTIGIGAGKSCDGQVLVMQDLLGLNPDFNPRFVKKYAELGLETKRAIATYASEVRDGIFPDKEHSF